MAESAALLVDEVLPHEPMRQWVLSVPFPLRFLFASQPKIMLRDGNVLLCGFCDLHANVGNGKFGAELGPLGARRGSAIPDIQTIFPFNIC